MNSLNSRNNSGFTLIELLVAVTIMGMIILAANNLFFYTLKGEKKANIQTKIKQNGSYALSSMATRVRSAVSIVNNCQPSGRLELKTADGGNIIFQITGDQIASNSTALTSSDLVASGLSFACNSPVGNPPTVVISFTLAKSGAVEESASQNFQTTVSLRSY